MHSHSHVRQSAPLGGKFLAIVVTALILLTSACGLEFPGMGNSTASTPPASTPAKTTKPTKPGKPVTPGKTVPTTPATAPQTVTTLAELENIFKNSPAQAEQPAMRFTEQENLSQNDLAAGLRILALSSLGTKHPNVTLSALERWRMAAPAVDGGQEWRNCWYNAISLLAAPEALKIASVVQADSSRPAALRFDAGNFISYNVLLKQGDFAGSMSKLGEIYGTAPSKAAKIEMEQRLFSWLHGVSSNDLDKLGKNASAENTNSFPFILVKLEEARRLALDPRTRELGAEIVDFLRQDVQLADPKILDKWQEVSTAPVLTPVSGQGIVLVLPMSGNFAKISAKVVQGAKIACNEFAATGHPLNLKVIDTDKAGWQAELTALPEDMLLIGGPLRASDYTALKASGQTSHRVLLSFLPRLEGNDEGQVAWRFFASPQDQIDSMLRFTSSLGVTSYGSFYPEDSYGNYMSGLFKQRVAASKGYIAKQSSYPTTAYGDWNSLIGSFLGTNKHANNAPATPYRALFLPDSWKNMEMLVPGFFYFRENRQILMGTSLWEQALSGQPHLAAHYYKLAIFPGAWNAYSSSPAVENLRLALANSQMEADFWTGLGYDFARFSSTVVVPKGWTAPEVNAMLAQNPGIPWSCAPIHWDGNGKASQELFLFTPVEGGFAPVDPVTFANEFNKAWNIK